MKFYKMNADGILSDAGEHEHVIVFQFGKDSRDSKTRFELFSWDRRPGDDKPFPVKVPADWKNHESGLYLRTRAQYCKLPCEENNLQELYDASGHVVGWSLIPRE